MIEPHPRPGRSDLDRLGDRLDEARTGAGLTPMPARTRADTAMGDGIRVAIEFVVSVLVGAGLGYFLGGFLGSAVIGLLAGLLFGFAAGLRGVYRGMMAGAGPADDESGPTANGDDGRDDSRP